MDYSIQQNMTARDVTGLSAIDCALNLRYILQVFGVFCAELHRIDGDGKILEISTGENYKSSGVGALQEIKGFGQVRRPSSSQRRSNRTCL